MTVTTTVNQPEPEREPDVRHSAEVGDVFTRCGLRLPGRRWTDDPNTPVDCPACLDVLDRASSPLATSPRLLTHDEVIEEVVDAFGAAAEARKLDPTVYVDPMPAIVGAWAETDAAAEEYERSQRDHDHGAALDEHDRRLYGRVHLGSLIAPSGVACTADLRDMATASTPDPTQVTCPDCMTLATEVVDETIIAPVSVAVAAETRPFAEALDAATAAVDVVLTQIGPPPERRTVGLEVLTDEHRAVGVSVDRAAKVGIVCRVNGRIVAVPEQDTLWHAKNREPADILAILLRQARMYAQGGIQGDGNAELLMPTPDVLAALAGRPLGRYTAPVETRWGLVQAGWYVHVETVVDGQGDVAWLLVEDRVDCFKPDCIVRKGPTWTCAVTTIRGRGIQHLDAFNPTMARIPADTEVTS